MDKLNGIVPQNINLSKREQTPAINTFRKLIATQLFDPDSTKTDIKQESQALMAQLNIERKYIN